MIEKNRPLTRNVIHYTLSAKPNQVEKESVSKRYK